MYFLCRMCLVLLLCCVVLSQGMEERIKIEPLSAKAVAQQYPARAVLALSELAHKQHDPHLFYQTILTEPVSNHHQQLERMAKEQDAHDLADRISLYHSVSQLPRELAASFKDLAFLETCKRFLCTRIIKYGTQREHFPLEKNEYVFNSALFEDGVVTRKDNELCIRSFDTGKRLQHFKDLNDHAKSAHTEWDFVTFFDSRYLVSYMNNAVKVWDYRNRSVVKKIVDGIPSELLERGNQGQSEIIVYVKNGNLTVWPFSLKEDPITIAHVGDDVETIYLFGDYHKILCKMHNQTGIFYDSRSGQQSENTIILPNQFSSFMFQDHTGQFFITNGPHFYSIWDVQKECCCNAGAFESEIEGVVLFSQREGQLKNRYIVYGATQADLCDYTDIIHSIYKKSVIRNVWTISDIPYFFLHTDNSIAMHDCQTGKELWSIEDENHLIYHVDTYANPWNNLLMCVMHDNNFNQQEQPSGCLRVYDYITGQLITQIEGLFESVIPCCVPEGEVGILMEHPINDENENDDLDKRYLINASDFKIVAQLTDENKQYDHYLLMKKIYETCARSEEITPHMLECLENENERLFLTKYVCGKEIMQKR